MKKISIRVLGVSFILAGLIISGCSLSGENSRDIKVETKQQQKVDEEAIGLRQTPLLDEVATVSNETTYSKEVAGGGYKIKRAFQDAPPMIPHDIEGMLPISRSSNACIDCHTPEVAESMGATPMPSSHFIDFRPKHNFDGNEFKKGVDVMKNEVSIKKQNNLVQARFNCSQCHAPQSAGNAPLNTFQPEFTGSNGEFKSSWKDEKFLEGLNTVVE